MWSLKYYADTTRRLNVLRSANMTLVFYLGCCSFLIKITPCLIVWSAPRCLNIELESIAIRKQEYYVGENVCCNPQVSSCLSVVELKSLLIIITQQNLRKNLKSINTVNIVHHYSSTILLVQKYTENIFLFWHSKCFGLQIR